jgi:hypothetical protein
MALTAREAGERVGKTRQAIIKAIRKGTLSAERDAAGEWRIEPAELFRVYPAVPVVDSNESITRLSSDTAGLRRELEIRDEKITSLEHRLAAVEADKGGGRVVGSKPKRGVQRLVERHRLCCAASRSARDSEPRLKTRPERCLRIVGSQ